MSDMAPNMSGIRTVDQDRAMALAESALEFAVNSLEPGGSFVCKVFHGRGFDEFVKQCRLSFERVVMRKPKASRSRSAETYAVCRGFRGVENP
jgi:23S rRNA (uridine2552-2'-O)-methyltransferase